MREALAFLTPFPGARHPSPRALRWFPVVGALLGLVLGGLWWATAKIWPLAVAAAIVVVADLALTGMLHMDGLADSADGLLPHLTRERRLAVMREPTIGAYGTAVVAVTLLARWAVFATLRPAPLLVAGLWCASRSAMATVVDRVPYARPDSQQSLVSAFRGRRLPAWLAGAALGLSAAAAGYWSLPAGTVAVAAGLVAFLAVVVLARHRLGGYTGDVLGAAGLIGESVGLLVAAAKW